MPHEIDRILAAAASHIWLIDEDKAQEIVNVLAVRASTGQGIDWAADEAKPVYAAETRQGRQGPIHVLQLHGTVMPRSGMMSRMSGGASLDQFMKAFDAAASDASAQAIVMDIDSPGGIVDFVPEAAERMFKARRADRPIVAVANPLCASAAYWLASAADEIVVTVSGRVGSVGVYQMHDDLSEALKMKGISRTVMKKGPRKAEGAIGPLDESAMKHREEEIGYIYDLFTKAVARNRGVDLSVVRADPEEAKEHFGGGRAYRAREAVRLGMADRIGTLEDTISRLQRGRLTPRTARARLSVI
ncbi:peptidase S49 [Celeribacter ethanolicus]|uniref:Peptidase S49 n=1 Tax=Celeribacter ethanolicus TaxID=1758178 RepID=A0A291GC24_9RHOB|nr:S49 family peptidase [Celeribacter ethanolicus]ATG47604.1 peptidase S49 [Celeribacter ethanolicus]